MSDVTPSGPVSVAVDGLRTLIAALAFFQAWTGEDSTDALARIFIGEAGYPIFSASVASGVLTIQTREPHMINPGDLITLEGASLGAQSALSVDGPQTVIAVTSTTLTIAADLPDLETVYPEHAFILPCVRPIAVIGESTDALHSEVIGTGGAAIFAGGLEILLEADVSQAYQNDSRNALVEARNAYGQFLQSLATTQGTLDLMCVNKIETASGPEFTAKPEQDDNAARFERWRAVVRVSWGIDS